MDEEISYIYDLFLNHGKIYCINFLVITQGLTLPDANFFLDIFVIGDL